MTWMLEVYYFVRFECVNRPHQVAYDAVSLATDVVIVHQEFTLGCATLDTSTNMTCLLFVAVGCSAPDCQGEGQGCRQQ